MFAFQPTPDSLSNLRKRRLLSQRALAKKAGIAMSTVALLEAGKPPPKATFETIKRICEALGVQPAEVKEFQRSLGITEPTTGSGG